MIYMQECLTINISYVTAGADVLFSTAFYISLLHLDVRLNSSGSKVFLLSGMRSSIILMSGVLLMWIPDFFLVLDDCVGPEGETELVCRWILDV